ncbi:MAG: DNA ligase, partial [Eggerthella lenta]
MRGISSLLLGQYEGGRLAYVGRVGSGLSEAASRELMAAFEGLERPDAPFADAPKPRSGERVVWLDPQVIVQVKFAEWTEDGLLRHPSYQGIRTDKDPRDVQREP